jgi:hypothetical protein
MAESKWDEMEGVFATSTGIGETDTGRITVARVSDEHGYQLLWSYELPNVRPEAVALTLCQDGRRLTVRIR